MRAPSVLNSAMNSSLEIDGDRSIEASIDQNEAAAFSMEQISIPIHCLQSCRSGKGPYQHPLLAPPDGLPPESTDHPDFRMNEIEAAMERDLRLKFNLEECRSRLKESQEDKEHRLLNLLAITGGGRLRSRSSHQSPLSSVSAISFTMSSCGNASFTSTIMTLRC